MMNFGDINSHTWLVFSNVDGLIVSGTGQIDGTGKSWWDSCPKALTFNRCNNLRLSGLRHVDSANNHISITNCAVVTISNIHITAPETSPNTDGIDISNSNRIVIHDSYIGTGDDCIAMINGCKYINITGVNCGPGHGISIGSLGKNGSRATVEELHVKNCTFNGTQNGARIKTWQGGSGYAKIISFVDIILIETGNPILIDQYYCPHNTCKDQTSAVGISNVSFTGFRGTTNTIDAIQLNCSKNVPCTDIELNQINIMPTPDMKPGTILQSTCINAHGTSNTSNNPKVTCLIQ
ncbi:probable polygalacturonase At3g15720 [Camellia sinensis]|uniref:probable polygalacturonase At3g15720 n=1 Tax=Camellia sinensis TaxID=4442 RepID=UPI0010356FA0|nr:probable polygalacturonase At3g15720 [Camellia sinensis]